MNNVLTQLGCGRSKILSWSSLLVWMALMTSPVCAQAALYNAPLPGDRITNIASGDFTDADGTLQVINSNPVELTISEVRALQLVSNVSQLGLIGGQISFPHLLSNTGNVPDTYTLSALQSSSDQFDLSNMAVYADRNQDGLPDDTINLLGSSNAIRLEPDQSMALVVTGLIPVSRSANDQAVLTLTATNSTSLSQTVTDTTTVTTGGVLNVTKAENKSSGPIDSIITYTLTYTNTGNSPAQLEITDVLDSTQLQYVSGSGLWNQGSGALTDASGENSGNSGINYQTTTSGTQTTLKAILASVPAQSTGQISFQVKVMSSAADRLPNTASYVQINGGTTVKTANTNTVVFALTHSYGVVANNKSSGSVNGGNPSSAPDNLITIASGSAGTEVLFDDYVWNTGDTQDVFNLDTTLTNGLSCARVRLYQTDGKTLLTDSNGDGLIDTGPVAAGSSVRVRVGIALGSSCQSTSTALVVDLRASSASQPGISDAVRNQLNAISGGSLDLYNGDNTGKNPQGIDNNGAAWVIRTADATGQAVFPLKVANLGNQPDSYTLLADQDGVLSAGLPVDLPTGWSVQFYSTSTPDCSVLGSAITRINNVAAGGIVNYCAVVQAPRGNASQPIWFGVRSGINGNTDQVKDQVNVGNVRQLELVNDQQGTIAVGGTLVYGHTLTNRGTVTEGASSGQLTISLDNSNANGLIHTVYYDANNNGLLDATDPQVSDLAALGPTNGAVGLSPNESIRLLVKVQASAQMIVGNSGSVTLKITPNGSIGGLTATAVQNTDLTRVTDGELRLIKSQALDAACDGTADGSYQLSALAVKPGQCVLYRIQATNQGSVTLTNVVISDTVPTFTSLRSTPAPSVSAGTVDTSQVSTTGQLQGNIGSVNVGQTASLNFAIQVQSQ